MNAKSEEFSRLLEQAVAFHGHLCGGQIIGVRMAMAGLRELGIKDPRGREGRDLVIFVEIDRCATDAIIAVTGRTPGRRSIKIMDYGKMAATFVNTNTGKAIRISARGDSRVITERLAATRFPEMDEDQAHLEALRIIPELDLFDINEVTVRMKPQDLPGEPLDTVVCEECGEAIRDMREVYVDGRTLCKPCAAGASYYTLEHDRCRCMCS